MRLRRWWKPWLRRQQVRAERWARKRARQPEPELIHVARKVAWLFDACPDCRRGWRVGRGGAGQTARRCTRCDGTGLIPSDKLRAYMTVGSDQVSVRWLAAFFFGGN